MRRSPQHWGLGAFQEARSGERAAVSKLAGDIGDCPTCQIQVAARIAQSCGTVRSLAGSGVRTWPQARAPGSAQRAHQTGPFWSAGALLQDHVPDASSLPVTRRPRTYHIAYVLAAECAIKLGKPRDPGAIHRLQQPHRSVSGPALRVPFARRQSVESPSRRRRPARAHR